MELPDHLMIDCCLPGVLRIVFTRGKMAKLFAGKRRGREVKVFGFFGGKFETSIGWRSPGGIGLSTPELVPFASRPVLWESLWRHWDVYYSKARDCWAFRKRRGAWVPLEVYNTLSNIIKEEV